MSNYVDVYTVDAYQERVDKLQTSISNVSGDYAIQGRFRLLKQIKRLKAKEQIIFEKLNVETIEELNTRLKVYQGEVLNLSGPDLYNEFLKQIREEKDDNSWFKDWFNQAVIETVEELVEENKGELAKHGNNLSLAVQSIFLTELNKGNNRGKFTSKKAFSINKADDLKEIINPALLPPSQKRKFLEIIQQRKEAKGEKIPVGEVDVKITSGENPTVQSWFDITDEQTSSKMSEKEKWKISNSIKRLILRKAPGANKERLSQVIDYVLRESDLKAFLVGKNDKQIIGILGEIQALYYVCSLTNTVPGESAKWVGGISQGGKQPHSDIILEKLGIQVKNTTKDLESQVNFDVSFWNLNLYNFLSKSHASANMKEFLETYFATYLFNVPYAKQDTNTYKRTSQSENPLFNKARADLRSLQNDINIVFSELAAELMYIDIAEDIPSVETNANVLYILGGTAAITASQILEKIYNDLGQETASTPLMIKASLDEKGFNIVSVLNEKSVLGKNTQTTFGSQNLVNNVKLQSVYRFNLSHYF